jgi:hypothetical protein
MRLPITQAFAAVLALVPGRMGEQLVAQPQSRLWVEGTSTIRSFECKVPEFALKVNADGAGAVKAVLSGQKAVRTVDLTVQSAKIDCGNGTMNEHMMKAVKAEEAPAIHFKLNTYDVARGAEGTSGTMHGTLALGGAEKPIDVAAVASEGADGALHVVGAYELALSDFDLKAPKLMFGRIKVGDKVKVKFDLLLKS